MARLLPQSLTLSMRLQLLIEFALLFMAATLLFARGSAGLAAAMPPALVLAGVLVALNAAFGLYRPVERASSARYGLRMTLAATIGIPLAVATDALLPAGLGVEPPVPAVVALALGLLLARHVVVRPALAWLAPHRVLVVGTGSDAGEVAASLAGLRSPGLSLVGFYPVGPDAAIDVPRARVIDRRATLAAVVRQHRVSDIVVAVREQRGGVLPLEDLLECRLAGVRVTDLARFHEEAHGRLPLQLVKASWLIYASGYRQHLLRAAVKRAFDVAVAAALLALALPLMAAAAAAIAIESGRPVLYRQSRVGRGGRPFTLWKFRSMRHDAERGAARWAEANDPRVTRVGAWMRRTRVDELPQLLNVLRGEMSFVGPRPERPEFVGLLAREIPFYAVRHSVKPGLTGWAQVRYSYGADVEQASRKLEYDLYYVKNHTLALDVLILLETVRVVMLGEGAR